MTSLIRSHLEAWPVAVREILGIEGGYHAGDARDAHSTNLGITLATLRGLGRQPLDLDRNGILEYAGADVGDFNGDGVVDRRDLLLMSVTQAEAIYESGYWKAASCHRIAPLAAALAVAVFDGAVQHGPEWSLRLLQRSLGSHQDGRFGPLTESAIRQRLLAVGEPEVVRQYLQARVTYYQALLANPIRVVNGQRVDLRLNANGWRNRVNKVCSVCGIDPVWETS